VKMVAVLSIIGGGGYLLNRFLQGEGGDLPPAGGIEYSEFTVFCKETDSTTIVAPGDTLVAMFDVTNITDDDRTAKFSFGIRRSTGSGLFDTTPDYHWVEETIDIPAQGKESIRLEQVVDTEWGKYDDIDVKINEERDGSDLVFSQDDMFLIDSSGGYAADFEQFHADDLYDSETPIKVGDTANVKITYDHKGEPTPIKVGVVMAREETREQGPYHVYYESIPETEFSTDADWKTYVTTITFDWPSDFIDYGHNYDGYLFVVPDDFDVEAAVDDWDLWDNSPWESKNAWKKDLYQASITGTEEDVTFEHLETILEDDEIPIKVGDNKLFTMTFDHKEGPAMTVIAGAVFSVEDNTSGGRSYPYYMVSKPVSVDATPDKGYTVNLPITWPAELNRIGQNYDAFLFVAPIEFDIDNAVDNDWSSWDTIPWSSKFAWKRDIYSLISGNGGDTTHDSTYTVIELYTSDPVPYAEVEIYNINNVLIKRLTADADGGFEYLLTDDWYNFRISAEGYITTDFEVIFSTIGEDPHIVFDLPLEGALPAKVAGYIKHVYWPYTPIQGAFIGVGTSSAYTNESGYFEMTYVPLGEQSVTVVAEGYISWEGTQTIISGDNSFGIIYMIPAPVTPIEYYNYGGVVWGRVYDPGTGALVHTGTVQGAFVIIHNDDLGTFTTTTDYYGNFRIDNIPEGTYGISISRDNYEPIVDSLIGIMRDTLSSSHYLTYDGPWPPF